MKEFLRSGVIDQGTLVRQEGSERWVPASNFQKPAPLPKTKDIEIRPLPPKKSSELPWFTLMWIGVSALGIGAIVAIVVAEVNRGKQNEPRVAAAQPASVSTSQAVESPPVVSEPAPASTKPHTKPHAEPATVQEPQKSQEPQEPAPKPTPKPTPKPAPVVPDFRNVKWGWSKAQVRAAEKNEFISGSGDTLLYREYMDAKDFNLGYMFVDNKLVRAGYVLDEQHTNKQGYLFDYLSLSRLLTEKYGKPTADETVWTNDLFRNDFDRWGLAISTGHLSKYQEWVTPTTTITLGIRGDNFKISLVIRYDSNKLGHLKEDRSKQESLDNL